MSSLYVHIVVEGDGEQRFIEQMIVPHLGARGVWATAFFADKKGRHGGVRPWISVRKRVCSFLRMDRPWHPMGVSLMFDYFRMPLDWPGRSEAPSLALAKRAQVIESAMAEDICSAMGNQFHPSRFVPYVQMHELEALILVQPEALLKRFPDRSAAVGELLDEIDGLQPEEVNDGDETAPSKRIGKHIPEYLNAKGTAAPDVLNVIGLPTLRERCPHFDQWVAKLEALGGE